MRAVDSVVVTILLLGALLAGATCGFFLAWTIAVLPGLDRIGAESTVAAMTSMNRAVLNPAFAVVFGGTPLALAAGCAACAVRGSWVAAVLAAAALIVLVLGVHVVTVAASIPLNEALSRDDGAGIAPVMAWESFSGPWQRWNLVRAVAAAVALSLQITAVAAVSVHRAG